MKRKLIKRNKQRLTSLFTYGNTVFPKPEFTNLKYLGNLGNFWGMAHAFSASGGIQVGNFTVCNDAVWGD